MACFLLLDFGASRIKSAIVDINSGFFSKIESYPSISNSSGIKEHCEISLLALRERFLSICDSYYNKKGVKFDGIALCSEMHGFAVLDKDNQPITDYISWKDERSLTVIDGIDTFELVKKEIGADFKAITGMKLRPGFPVVNLCHMARVSKFEEEVKIISIPEWLALSSDDSANNVHKTMIAGLGVYDLKQNKPSEKIMGLFEKISGVGLTLNKVVPEGAISGYWHNNSGKIPIYAGVGDHQCAVLGAGNKPKKTVSVNIGTGSQVAIINQDFITSQVELRPFFDSDSLSTITHIPSGRVLNEYVKFIENIYKSVSGHEFNCWKLLNEITEKKIMESSLEFDLAIFSSAWNYQGGGKISNITEGSLNLENYLASLLKSFIQQYINAIKIVDSANNAEKIILSGGIPQKLPVIISVISKMTGLEVYSATEIDETFLGLRTLALISSGLCSDYLEAQQIYGRNVTVI